MEKRTRRSPARFLAPLALIAVIVVFLSIVSASSKNGSTTTDSTTTTSTTSTTSTTKKKSTGTTTSKSQSQASGRRTYTVQVGDTLGGIAAKTGVPLSQIESLNPNVDPHAMTTGQKIRLR